METNTAVVEFDITEAAITSLAEKYADPKVPANADEYDALKAGIKEVATVRIAIDKERKAQTAAALAHQREVNKVGNGIIDRLKAIETPMKLAKAEVDEAEKRRVREAEEAEKARLDKINTRLSNIVDYGTVSINDSLKDVKQRLARVEELDPTQGFDEFAKTAAEYRGKALANLKAGLETLEKQAELDRRTKELEEREAKAKAEDEERERKAKAKQDELDEEERKRKAAEQEEERKRLKKLEDEQKERDRLAKDEADEKLRLEQAPDKEKLTDYASRLRALDQPELDSVAGAAAMGRVMALVSVLIDNICAEADRL